MAGDGRRADVDRDTVRAVVEPWPDGDDVAAAVYRDGDPVRAGGQGRLHPADDGEVGAQVMEAPLGRERVEEPPEVAGGRGEIGLLDVDGMQPHDGIHLERACRQVLADDLAMDLALGRDVDDEVTEHACGAGQPSVVSQTRYLAVLGLDGVGLRQVVGG